MIYFLNKIQCKQLITCIPCERSNFTLPRDLGVQLHVTKGIQVYITHVLIGKQLVWFMPIDESCSALRARSSKRKVPTGL